MSDSAGPESIPLGRTDVLIPPLGMGTWAWGDRLVWGYGRSHGRKEVEAAFSSSLEAGNPVLRHRGDLRPRDLRATPGRVWRQRGIAHHPGHEVPPLPLEATPGEPAGSSQGEPRPPESPARRPVPAPSHPAPDPHGAVVGRDGGREGRWPHSRDRDLQLLAGSVAPGPRHSRAPRHSSGVSSGRVQPPGARPGAKRSARRLPSWA